MECVLRMGIESIGYRYGPVEASYKQGLVPQKMEQFGIYEEQGMRMF
jgi:hypothetical protein